jgi:hypothetical protein
VSQNGVHKVKRPGIVLPDGTPAVKPGPINVPTKTGTVVDREPGLFPEFLFVARDPDKGESGIKIALKPGGFVSISKYDDKGKADALYQWNGSDWTDAHGLIALDADKAN